MWYMFNEAFVSGIYDGVTEILTMNPSSSSMGNLWGIVEKIYNDIMIPIGVGLMFIYFLVHLLKISSDERFTWEQFFLLMARLIFGIFLINYGMEIMSQLYSWGITLTKDYLKDAQNGNSYGKTELEKIWKDLSGCEWGEDVSWYKFWVWVPLFIQLIIPYLASILIKIYIRVVCYARIIEILLRTALAPVAFADFFSEGTHGAGFKFLKSYVAVCLQGVAICIIIDIFQVYSAAIVSTSSFMTFWMAYICIGFSAAAVIGKSQTIIRDVIGG